MKPTELLPALIRMTVCGKSMSEELKRELEALSPEEERALYALAQRQDMAHLVSEAAHRLGVVWKEPSVGGAYQKQQMTAVFRTQNLLHELEALSHVLEEERIEFVPLKGSVLRDYYPEAWMRTSCDIDVLVRKSDLDRAVKVLSERLSYQAGMLHSHDIPLETPSGMHVELHYSLLEDAKDMDAGFFSRVWEYVLPIDTGRSQRVLSEPFFYCYHLAHMSKHMLHGGGCGIRPFLDLWLLLQREGHDAEACEQLLSESGYARFGAAARKLAAVWFEEAPADPITDEFADWILGSGIYGSLDSRVTLKRSGGKQSRSSYFFHRLLLPYESLKWTYPHLNGRKWLLPYYQVRRWFDILISGRMKRVRRELSLNANLSAEQAARAEALVKHLGLDT